MWPVANSGLLNMAHVAWFAVLIASVGAFREIDFKHCKTPNGDRACKVKSVKIHGCLNPSSWTDTDGKVVEYEIGDVKSPCRLANNKTLSYTITFEPGFATNAVRSQFTLPELPDCWGVMNTLDSQCPLSDPPQSPCGTMTKCPLQAGREQRFEGVLQISPYATPRPVNLRKIFQMRWKLWNNKNKDHNCCINVPIQY